MMTTEEKLEIISQVCKERGINSLIKKGAMLEAMNRMDAIYIANNIIEGLEPLKSSQSKPRVELDCELAAMTVNNRSNYPECLPNNEYSYRFTSRTRLSEKQLESIKITVEVDEPQTIKEFLKEHRMPESLLLKWLNKNYK